MDTFSTDDPLAVAAIASVHAGDAEELTRLLADARAFGQWEAAHRLVERGAKTTVVDAATLGLQDRLEQYFESSPPDHDEIDAAFWGACHGGQQQCAEYLLGRGVPR